MINIKVRIYILSYLVAWVFHADLGWATEDSREYDTRTEITTLVNQIVHEIDPAAQVGVKLSTQKINTSLPGTPFLAKNIEISPLLSDRLLGVEITVFTTTGDLPKSVQEMIRELTKDYTKNVSFILRPIPGEFVSARQTLIDKQAKDLRLTPPSASGEIAKAWETPLSTVLNLIPDNLENIREITRLGGLVAAGIVVLAFITTLLWMRMQRLALGAIRQGFHDIANVLEQGGSGSIRTIAAEATPALPKIRHQELPTASTNFGLSVMPENGLLALLADCYWSANDSYGAFLWRRIPAEKKLNLIQKMPELNDYGTFLNDFSEADIGVEQDPSYLTPLPIWHLDMDALTNLVRKNPRLMKRLSPLRAAALNLKPSERLAIHTDAQSFASKSATSAVIIPKIEEHRSPPRKLKQTLRLHVKSEADELEILAMVQPTAEIVEDVLSLGWLLKLPDQRISEILQAFSARDLASAWIGPTEVLNQLSGHIGEKKMALLNSHLVKQRPSRSSRAFLDLHRAALEELYGSLEKIHDGENKMERTTGHAA